MATYKSTCRFRLHTYPVLFSLVVLLILSTSKTLVEASKHQLQHQHHKRTTSTQGDLIINPLQANHTTSNYTGTSDDYQYIVAAALNALATTNRLRLENVQFNKLKFSNVSSMNNNANPAPPLNYSTSSWNETISKRDSQNAQALNSTGTGNSSRSYTYSLPEELIEAARIVAELSPPIPPIGNHDQIAAQIRKKYALKVNDTNVMAQALHRPDGLSGYIPQFDNLVADTTTSNATVKRSSSDYWMGAIQQHGISPFAPSGYQVWRNVLDYGAKGDGVTDDTAAINRAISEGGRCGANCGSSTIFPATVYFPSGTYLVSSPIIQYYNTQLLGNPLDVPTILAAASFVGLGVISSDVYTGDKEEWYINQNNFLRSVRNFKVDIRPTDKSAYICAIHWQVAQGTSLENIIFYMSTDSDTTQQGIYMENGSGGFLSDLTFVGGNFGAYFGNQQFTTSHLIFVNCATALQVHWDWAWTMQDVVIESCGQGLVIVGGAGGVESTGQSVGSLILVDANIANTPVGIVTSLYSENSTSLLLQNVGFYNVPIAVQDQVEQKVLLTGGDSVLVDNWGFGMVNAGEIGEESFFASGENIPVMNRTASLLGSTSYNKRNFFTRRRPRYEDLGNSQVIDAKVNGAKGDGISDDTAALNSIFSNAANMSAIVYIPFGVYIITDTVNVPVGSRIIGQAWSQIMATGSRFEDALNPHVAVKVGEPGDVGILEIQDMLFTVSGPTAGAILMEWNVHESTQGSVGLWDSHFRIGGAIGSNLQTSECPKLSGHVNTNCIAASLLMHITPQSSAYLENVWLWVADHDLDVNSQDQIDVYSARGLLIESQGPTWLYGTASEHNVLYQYQVSGAKNVLMAMIQTESPYFQVSPAAPAPFKPGLFSNDPLFDDCVDSSKSCAASWAVRIVDSSTVYVLGAGLYSWFSEYSQDCLATEDCQARAFEIEESYDLWIYNLATKAIQEMVSPLEAAPTYAKDNVNGFLSSILAWLRGQNGETIGQRSFTGFQIYQPDWLDGLPEICKTALTQVIKCDNNVELFEEPAYRGDLGNDTLTDSVCDASCGASLKNYFDTVAQLCSGYNITGAPATKIGGSLWAGWNETCVKDIGTDQYCNKIILNFAEVEDTQDMPQSEMCSYCYVKKLQMMQSSPYSFYDEHFKANFDTVSQVCGLTGSTDILPPLFTTEQLSPICLSDNIYTTSAGDSCDSISLVSSVSSASLYMGNAQAQMNCTSLDAGLDLCIPLQCQTYELQGNDTCTSIETELGLPLASIRSYNAWVSFDCSNLHVASQVYGNILCLSPQGGIFNSTAASPGVKIHPSDASGYAQDRVNPPQNATIATGTTLNCGKWHTAVQDETCASICVQEGLTISTFILVNPSLSNSGCTASLATNLTYCVQPTYSWNRTTTDDSSYPSPTPTSTSISTSSTSTFTSSTSICSASPTVVSVTFEVVVTTLSTDLIRILGTNAELGKWNIPDSIALSKSEYTDENPVWKVTISFPPEAYVEYKYINVAQDGSISWEVDPNHSFTISSGCQSEIIVEDNWRYW